MEELLIQVIAQFPTVGGLVFAALVLREELNKSRLEAREAQIFMQKLLLIMLDADSDAAAVSIARSVLRSKIEDD
jgi:hypothetical protein